MDWDGPADRKRTKQLMRKVKNKSMTEAVLSVLSVFG